MRRAGRALAVALACLAGPLTGPSLLRAQDAPPWPVDGLVTRSLRIPPGRYVVTPRDSGPVLVVRGEGITLDLTGVVLERAGDRRFPDRFAGTAILVDGGRDIAIRGGTIRGFKVAIRARDVAGFTLRDSDLSHNWRPRLFSGPAHESLADWLSFHRNERNEWLRYGAGAYLEGIRGGEVRGVTVRQGMNGVLLVRSEEVTLLGNDLSWNSGVGIGLYRSSHNRILHNRASFNVRGYVHGRYARGQDSAALLLFEQCSANVVAYNVMTHSGDGLFLWAGQSTMDDGQGGSNDNLFYRNDFSYAATNAMEATFSRNRFVENRAWGSTHGLWGGYSYGNEIRGNDFRGNRVGIAIEHGQANRIVGNRFDGDSTAIRLWWNPIEPSDWGYPRHRDTRSRDYLIAGNTFAHHRTALRVEGTQEVVHGGNRFRDVDSVVVARGDTSGWRHDPSAGDQSGGARLVPLVPGFADPTEMPPPLAGREAIRVDAWGPDDGARAGRVGPSAPPLDWTLAIAAWDSTSDPRTTDGLVALRDRLAGPSAIRRTARGLDWVWFRPAEPEIPPARWAMTGSAVTVVPAGAWLLRTISDDAIRVWVDDRLVIDYWTPHESAVDEVPLAPGPHRLRFDYVQVEGWTEVRVELAPADDGLP